MEALRELLPEVPGEITIFVVSANGRSTQPLAPEPWGFVGKLPVYYGQNVSIKTLTDDISAEHSYMLFESLAAISLAATEPTPLRNRSGKFIAAKEWDKLICSTWPPYIGPPMKVWDLLYQGRTRPLPLEEFTSQRLIEATVEGEPSLAQPEAIAQPSTERTIKYPAWYDVIAFVGNYPFVMVDCPLCANGNLGEADNEYIRDFVAKLVATYQELSTGGCLPLTQAHDIQRFGNERIHAPNVDVASDLGTLKLYALTADERALLASIQMDTGTSKEFKELLTFEFWKTVWVRQPSDIRAVFGPNQRYDPYPKLSLQ